MGQEARVGGIGSKSGWYRKQGWGGQEARLALMGGTREGVAGNRVT